MKRISDSLRVRKKNKLLYTLLPIVDERTYNGQIKGFARHVNIQLTLVVA